MRHEIDLNADLGEGGGSDELLLERVSSASISCGAHAGEPSQILETMRFAQAQGVVIGAHPGYADRENFGRVEREIGRDEVRRLIIDQCESLSAIAREIGTRVRFIKPHGALYNQAQRCEDVAQGVIDAAVALGLPLLGMPGGVLARLATERGVRLFLEGFPERRYTRDGRLAPRSERDAVLTDPEAIREQLRRLLDSKVETLCIHGDDPDAVAKCDAVRAVLGEEGVTIRSAIGIG